MIQKFLAYLLIVCGLIMAVVGKINHWPLHIIFGAIAFFCGLAALFYVLASNAPFYDEKNHRYYRFAKESDSPHHGFCPIRTKIPKISTVDKRWNPVADKNGKTTIMKCGLRSPVIYTVYGARHYGIYCEIHSEQWSDTQPIHMEDIPSVEREVVCAEV